MLQAFVWHIEHEDCRHACLQIANAFKDQDLVRLNANTQDISLLATVFATWVRNGHCQAAILHIARYLYNHCDLDPGRPSHLANLATPIGKLWQIAENGSDERTDCMLAIGAIAASTNGTTIGRAKQQELANLATPFGKVFDADILELLLMWPRIWFSIPMNRSSSPTLRIPSESCCSIPSIAAAHTRQ